MIHTLKRLSNNGDSSIAEWDTESLTPKRLHEIEQEFNLYREKGWFAADLTNGRNTLVENFDKDADLLLIPRVQGG